MTDGERKVGRFDALQEPVFKRLLTGGLFTFLAMQTSVIARAWLAFDLTGTNTALGGVLIGFGLSSVIAIPMGGVLADRFPKRMVLLVAGMIQTLTSLALAIAVVTDLVAYWHLIVASIIQGGVISLLGPARLAFVAEAVSPDRMTNAILLSQSTFQLTRVVGPATAGALIGISFFGVGGVYFVSAGLAFIAVLLTFGLPEGRPKIKSQRSPTEDLLDGVRYVRNTPRLARLLTLSFSVVLIGFPYVAFLPVFAEEIFEAGSGGFGLMATAGAIGALISSLVLAGVNQALIPRIQAVAAVAFGLCLVVLGIAPQFITALVVLLAVGASSAAFQALNNTLVLKIAPIEYHGRVQSLLMLGFSGFGFAALPLGIVADAVGLRQTIVGMGSIVTIIAIASIFIERTKQGVRL